jgi:aminoglycoside 6'-N-acetyltransferase
MLAPLSFGHVEFRFLPLRREDFPLLSEWFAKEHVTRFWGEPSDLSSIEAQYGPSVDGRDPTELFIVHMGDERIGMIQRYRIDDNPEWKQSLAVAGSPEAAAGIDYLIGEERLTGRGVGPEMISHFVEDTWRRYPDIAAITVAVQQQNRRSWRALEKAGFERTWAGTIESDDPSDEGPSYVYVLARP